MKIRFNREDSGQALVEMSFGFIVLCVFVFGAIDFGRAVYASEVMKNLAGEGSSMAEHGTPIANVANNVVNYAGADINLSSQGCVIITTVTNEGPPPPGTPVLAITGQATVCAITAQSKIGCLKGVNGCQSSTPVLPAGAAAALSAEPTNSNLSVTEIYYNFAPITPIAGLMKGNLLPSQMYSVAYY
jgi:TadE-like protein